MIHEKRFLYGYGQVGSGKAKKMEKERGWESEAAGRKYVCQKTNIVFMNLVCIGVYIAICINT